MISREQIYSRFIDACELILSNDVASVPDSSGNGKPAIFKDYDTFPEGRYPYVLVQVGDRRKQTDWAVFKHYNSAGDTETATVYTYTVTYNFYSNGSLEAHDLAEKLESSFVRQDVLNLFCVDGFGSIATVSDVNTDVFKEDNQAKAFANFFVSFTTTHVEVETEDEITTVNFDLSLRHKNSEEDIISTSYPDQN